MIPQHDFQQELLNALHSHLQKVNFETKLFLHVKDICRHQ